MFGNIRYIIFILGVTSTISYSFAAKPLWNITVLAGDNIQAIAENVIGTISYKIENKTKKTQSLKLYPTPGLEQTGPCLLAPQGLPGDQCTVTLKIIGHLLPDSGLSEGPFFCPDKSKGPINKNQCNQPDTKGRLSLKKTRNLSNWNNWGQNIKNNHFNINSGIFKDNIGKMAELCKIDYTQGLVPSPLNAASFSNSAKPVLIKDTIYWTGFSGKIGAHKILRNKYGKFKACKSLWVKDISETLELIAAENKTPSVRSSPAYYKRANGKGTLLYTGISSPMSLISSLWFITAPMAFALDAATGEMLWKIDLVDLSQVAIGGESLMPSTTASPRIYNNTAYLGLASHNNMVDTLPQTFRGHMIALDLGGDGLSPDRPSIKWTQYTIPAPAAGYTPAKWFAGGGIWASSPSIIPELGLVIFGSGQLYNYPDFAASCMDKAEPITMPTFSTTKKGETGTGAQQCLQEAEAKLVSMGINQPLASNSIIALNMQDGSFAWHIPTSGLDSWQNTCGPDGSNPCNVPVSGPDWDVGGNSPLIADLKAHGKVVISHNKGGEVFWIKASTGELLRKVDVCVGSSFGGIHWGLSYDPKSETIFAACAAGGIAPKGPVNFMSVLANGRKTCMTGYLNAIDANTGALKWQSIPASSEIVDVNSSGCADNFSSHDERFKYGLDFDLVLKNNQFNVPVNIMPDSQSMPLANQQKARSNGIPAVSNNIVYWPVYYGTVYALDTATGKYLNQFHCDQGALYSAGPSVAKGLLMFGCGYGYFNADDRGKSIMIYGLPNIATVKSRAN